MNLKRLTWSRSKYFHDEIEKISSPKMVLISIRSRSFWNGIESKSFGSLYLKSKLAYSFGWEPTYLTAYHKIRIIKIGMARLSTQTAESQIMRDISNQSQTFQDRESMEKATDFDRILKRTVGGKLESLSERLESMIESRNIKITNFEWKLLKNACHELKSEYQGGSESALSSRSSIQDNWSYLLKLISTFNEKASKIVTLNLEQKRNVDNFLSYAFKKNIDYSVENNLEWRKISANIPESLIYIDNYFLFSIAKIPDQELLETWFSNYRKGQRLLNVNEEEIANNINIAKNIYQKIASKPLVSPKAKETEIIKDINHYILLLKSITDPVHFKAICQEVFNLNLTLTIPFYNVLFKFYFKHGQISDAKALLEKISNQKRFHVSILNNYLNGLFMNGLYDEAISFYNQFSTVYHVSPNASTMTILITQCVKRGMLRASIRYYEQSLHMNIILPLKGREHALQALASLDIKKAESLFIDLSKSTYITNKMYFYMISGYAREKLHEKVIDLFQKMQDNRKYKVSLSFAQYAILAHASLDPSLSKAFTLYYSYLRELLNEKERMKEDHPNNSLIGDWIVGFYAKFMQSAANHPDSTAIIQKLFEDVSDLKLDTSPLMHFMVSTFSKLGDAKRAWIWYRILDSKGYKLPMNATNELIIVLMKTNRREEMEKLIHNFLSYDSANTTILNGLLFCRLHSSQENFEEILFKHENIAWNNQTFAFVLQFYASKGNFLLSWNMWLKYLDWVDEKCATRKVESRVVRTMISWCVVMDKPDYLVKVFQEAVLKRKVSDETLYDISHIEIPRGFETSRAFISHCIS